MAYVIVVQRAMDVRVVLRQGVQYAFARGGLVGLRAVISAAILAAMMLLSSRPNTPRWQVFAIFATGVLLLSVMGRLARWLVGWIDRRFFREAYNAEQILTELSERVRTIVQAQPLLETISRNIADSLHVERIATLLGDFTSCYSP